MRCLQCWLCVLKFLVGLRCGYAIKCLVKGGIRPAVDAQIIFSRTGGSIDGSINGLVAELLDQFVQLVLKVCVDVYDGVDVALS